MGLISLIKNVAGTTFDSISSQIQDQYLEFFTQDSLGQEILVKKGANKMERAETRVIPKLSPTAPSSPWPTASA